ncbi:MAG: BTAD domain-containing putative transcriptional regulator [Dehalococcoidia bacterium]
MRVYLAGTVAFESGELLIDERRFPGKQGLLVSAYLTLERRRPVARDELAEVVWGPEPPPAWDSALNAIVSKLRGLLRDLPGGNSSISGHLGRYQMHLPPDTWVDVEAARQALDTAEGALRGGAYDDAWVAANIVIAVMGRPFLSGVGSSWAESQRERMRSWQVRGLDCLSEVSLRKGQHALAIQHANEAVTLEPLRELGHRALMRTYVALGDRAEALKAYEHCRRLLSEELGVDPSPETEAVYREALGPEG